MHDKLVAKVNAIDTSGFVLKIKCCADKSDLEKKVPDISGLVRKRDYNAKTTEIEGKMPSITGLATTAALNAFKNKIPYVSNLVKKLDYDLKILDIRSKYITTADYNKFTKSIVPNKIKSERLVKKSAIAGFINNVYLDNIVATLSTNSELEAEQDKITKLQAFDLS